MTFSRPIRHSQLISQPHLISQRALQAVLAALLVPDQANKERKFYLFLESRLMRTEIVRRRVSPLCSFENKWSVMRMAFLAWSG